MIRSEIFPVPLLVAGLNNAFIERVQEKEVLDKLLVNELVADVPLQIDGKIVSLVNKGVGKTVNVKRLLGPSQPVVSFT